MSLELGDRDIFALYKVLDRALHEEEQLFDRARHARMVVLKLQQYVEEKLTEDKEYETKLRINL